MASLIENMAPEYTTDGAKAGNYYMHSKLLYLCKSDCSGLFDESNFEQVYLSDLLRGTANSNLVKFKYGCLTVPAGSASRSITVDVGFEPNLILIWCQRSDSTAGAPKYFTDGGTYTYPLSYFKNSNGVFQHYGAYYASSGVTSVDSTSFTFGCGSSITMYYSYLAMKIDESLLPSTDTV